MRLAVALLALEAKQYDAAGEFFESGRWTRQGRQAGRRGAAASGAWAC